MPGLLLSTACWFEPVPPADSANGAAGADEAIRAQLHASARAWNSGNLEGFMDDYLDSTITTYVGSSGLVTGFEAIRARYAPRFAPGARRDSLRFESLQVRIPAEGVALTTGRFVLYRNPATGAAARSTTASGPFTLILRRMPAGWRIVHDHTSSDPPPAAPDSARAGSAREAEPARGPPNG